MVIDFALTSLNKSIPLSGIWSKSAMTSFIVSSTRLCRNFNNSRSCFTAMDKLSSFPGLGSAIPKALRVFGSIVSIGMEALRIQLSRLIPCVILNFCTVIGFPSGVAICASSCLRSLGTWNSSVARIGHISII